MTRLVRYEADVDPGSCVILFPGPHQRLPRVCYFVSGFKFVLGETHEGCHINYPGCNVLIISPTHPTLSTSQSEPPPPQPTLASDRMKPRGGNGSWAGACVILCPDRRSPHRRQQLVRGGGSGALDCKLLIREHVLCDFLRFST